MDEIPPTVAAVEVVMPRLPAAASDAAFSVITLEAADIDGRQRVDQALSQAPGVSLFRRNSSLSANPTTQGISLRSIAPSGAGRALVTLDGVPQNDPFGGWVIWGGLPPELVQSISLVRGGGAGPYGAGALTGVINMSERARPGYELDLRGGEMGTHRGALVAETEAGGLDLLFGASAGETDGYVPVREGRGPADTKLSEDDWSVTGRITGAIGDSRLSLHLNAFDESRESGLAGAAARAEGQSASLTLGRAPTPTSLGYRLQAWVRKSNLENSSVSVNADRTATTPANDQYKVPSTGYGFNGALRGGGADREWELGADVRATTGETREHYSYVSGAFTRNRIAGGDALVAGLYAEGALKRGDWLLTGGVRGDYWSSTNAKRVETLLSTGAATLDSRAPDRDGWLPTARAGVRRSFGDAYVRTAAYVGFRPPTLNELHRPFRVGNDTTEANPALDPEKLYGLDAAIGWDGEATSASATVFVNRLADAVTNVTISTSPSGTTRQRQNAGRIDAWGVEAEASHRYSDAIEVRAAGSYTEAEVDGGGRAPQLTGLQPAQAPRLTLTAGVVWKPVERLSIQAQGRYESARYEDDLNSRKLGAAGVVDVRAGYQLRPGVEIYVSADNLFDEDVQTGQTADGVYSYGQPRLVSVGLNLRR